MHLKIFSSQMITLIGPKMSAAIEELIHTIATLRTRMKSFPEWYIYLAGHIYQVMHVSHTITRCWDKTVVLFRPDWSQTHAGDTVQGSSLDFAIV